MPCLLPYAIAYKDQPSDNVGGDYKGYEFQEAGILGGHHKLASTGFNNFIDLFKEPAFGLFDLSLLCSYSWFDWFLLLSLLFPSFHR